jgi:hypothetical protein
MNQVIAPIYQRLIPAVPHDDVHLYEGPAYLNAPHYLACSARRPAAVINKGQKKLSSRNVTKVVMLCP